MTHTTITAPTAPITFTFTIGGYADADEVDVHFVDWGSEMFARWPGGPEFGLMAKLIGTTWVAATVNGHLMVAQDREEVIELLAYEARRS